MDKIDRLGWVAGVSFSSYGVRVGIRTNEPLLRAQLSKYLPPRWKPVTHRTVDVLYSVLVGKDRPGSRIRHYHLLYEGAARVTRSLAVFDILDSLQSRLHLQIATRAPRDLFVHAGVVGWQGAAILIPGRSFTGKSSLVSALVEAGAEYLSDEYAVLDHLGRVHPYPKPLHLRGKENGGRGTLFRLPAARGNHALPIALIAVTEFHSDARWRPRTLSPAEALLALLANTVQARTQPAKALTVLGRVVNGSRSIKTKRGEAREVARPLLAEVEQLPMSAAPSSRFPAVSRSKENLNAASISNR
jgi:hypothetical protein